VNCELNATYQPKKPKTIVLKIGSAGEPNTNPVQLSLTTENERKTGFNRKPPIWSVKLRTVLF